jgi:hypothetical protein
MTASLRPAGDSRMKNDRPARFLLIVVDSVQAT